MTALPEFRGTSPRMLSQMDTYARDAKALSDEGRDAKQDKPRKKIHVYGSQVVGQAVHVWRLVRRARARHYPTWLQLAPLLRVSAHRQGA